MPGNFAKQGHSTNNSLKKRQFSVDKILTTNHLGTTSYPYMGVSKNNGTPKSSILIGFSIINHPFWDTTIFGNTHIHSTCIIFLGGATIMMNGTFGSSVGM